MSSTTTPDSGAEILARIIRPEQGRMTPEAAREILEYKLPPDDCERVSSLAAKSRDGTLTADERTVLDEYERVAALVEIMQSKARLSLKQAGLSP
jgi:hypothetical protein